MNLFSAKKAFLVILSSSFPLFSIVINESSNTIPSSQNISRPEDTNSNRDYPHSNGPGVRHISVNGTVTGVNEEAQTETENSGKTTGVGIGAPGGGAYIQESPMYKGPSSEPERPVRR